MWNVERNQATILTINKKYIEKWHTVLPLQNLKMKYLINIGQEELYYALVIEGGSSHSNSYIK